MAQRRGQYKDFKAAIKILEARIENCTHISKSCEQSAVEAEIYIEEQFAKYINELAARKAELLRKVSYQLTNQKTIITETRNKLELLLQDCYQNPACNGFHYEIKHLPLIQPKELKAAIPSIISGQIFADLPSSLLSTIQTHGEVAITSRFLTPDAVTTFAGSVGGYKDGPEGQFNFPAGICVNTYDESLYICDHNNNAIRKLTIKGEVSTFAGGIRGPSAIVMNKQDQTFFVSNSSNVICKISSSGVVSSFAGSGRCVSEDGTGLKASFNKPRGITIDQRTGDLFVCDWGSNLIRKITPQGEVSTLAGTVSGFEDGTGTTAKFNHPSGIYFDEKQQLLLVCDSHNHKLRQVNLNGDVSTLCEITCPMDVIIANNSILVASLCQVFKVIKQGSTYEAVVLAGSGIADSIDGIPELSSFISNHSIAVHEPSHSCFVSEFGKHVIRKISFL